MTVSFGVEEEFLLVHPTAAHLLPRGAEVIDAAARMGVRLHKELTTAQIETNTSVCWTLPQLRRELYDQRCAAASAAEQAGVRLVAAGATLAGSPVAPVADSPRYRRMADEFGLLASSGVCGCHVHVGVADRETAVQVGNHVRPWLPTLLALTANSTVYCGQHTGYASWRSILLSRWPFSGPPPYLTSAEHYDALVAQAMESGAALDPAMVYWDVRPSEHVPTVEIRVSDVPSTVAETTLLAGLVRGLVAAAVRALGTGRTGPLVSEETLRVAYWLGARDGCLGAALDPFTLRRTTVPALLAALLHQISDELEEWGELREIRNLVRTVLAQGNGAIRQHDALSRRGRLADVVDQAAKLTLSF
jgi:glutamate---cysteine ligase / carboxylate-amine ligase